MGQVTQELERGFTQLVGVKHALAVTNGTAALHLAFAALDLGPGDEIICPSLSFVAFRLCQGQPDRVSLFIEDYNSAGPPAPVMDG